MLDGALPRFVNLPLMFTVPLGYDNNDIAV